MIRTPQCIQLGDWEFSAGASDDDPENYPLFESSDIIEIAKDYAQQEALRHGNRLDGPIAASYINYWLQILKDLNAWWLARQQGKRLSPDQRMDVTIAQAYPWRFTCHFIDYLNSECASKLRAFATTKECIDLFQQHIPLAVTTGALYSFTRYQKVAHFLMDLAYDAGWSKEYRGVRGLKEREGIEDNIERATVHHILALYFAQAAAKRGKFMAGKELLIFGFPSAIAQINNMNENTVSTLLKQPPKKIVKFLMGAQISEEHIQKNAQAIANGALGLLRGS